MSDPRAFFLHLLNKYAPLSEHPLLVVRAVEEVLWEGNFNDEEKVTIAQWVVGQFVGNDKPRQSTKDEQAQRN
jgi:hypothetical protein